MEFLHFTRKHGFGRGCRVNTRRFNGNHNMSLWFQKVMTIERDNAGLIGLRDIGKDRIDHANEHAIFEGMAGIFNNRDNIGAFAGYSQQITARSMTEFHGIDRARRSDNVGNVRNRRAGGGSNVQYLGAGLNPNVIDASQNGGGDCCVLV